MKPQEVFGPQVKDFNHGRSDRVECRKPACPGIALCTAVLKAGDGKEWSQHNVWQEKKNKFDHPSKVGGLQRRSQTRVIVNWSPQAHSLEENIFMQKIPRHYALITEVSCILKLRKDFEWKIGGIPLNNSCEANEGVFFCQIFLEKSMHVLCFRYAARTIQS